jgi:hypothetical protein
MSIKVKLPEIQLTSQEVKFLVSLLRQDKENLHMDLSGADCIDITPTAIRLLNDENSIVDSLLEKLGGEK